MPAICQLLPFFCYLREQRSPTFSEEGIEETALLAGTCLFIYAYRVKILLSPELNLNSSHFLILLFPSGYLFLGKKSYLAVLIQILILLLHVHLGKSLEQDQTFIRSLGFHLFYACIAS